MWKLQSICYINWLKYEATLYIHKYTFLALFFKKLTYYQNNTNLIRNSKQPKHTKHYCDKYIYKLFPCYIIIKLR